MRRESRKTLAGGVAPVRRRLCLWAALFLGLGAPAAAADSIVLMNGQRHDNVQILSAKTDVVQYKLAGAPQAQSQPADKVLSLTRESNLLQRPRSAIESGNTALALKDLEAILAAPSKDGDWQKAEAAYLIARAHRVAGDYKKAIDAYKAYLEKHKAEKDWWLPTATNELGETLVLAKQPGTAEVSFKELAAYGGQWTLRSKLGEATAALAGKGGSDAMKVRSLADEVARNREAPPELRAQAYLLRAKALLAQKNPAQAIKELQDAFFQAARAGEIEYSAERAEATLLVGKAYLLQEGKESQDQAELWLLRVPALYRRYPGIFGEACDLLSAFYEQAGNAQRSQEWKSRKAGGGATSTPQAAAPAAAPAAGAPPPSPQKKAEPRAAPKAPPKKAP